MRIILATASLLLLSIAALCAQQKTNLDAARQTARWLKSTSVRTPQGTAWPADPRDSKTLSRSLYSGASGVVLFFLEAHRATNDKQYLNDARSGADYLLATLADEKDVGLYTGLAGIGFALQETFKSTRDPKYREGARRVAEMIMGRAIKSGKGIQWTDSTDVISGSAGVGLFLLYAARELNQPSFRNIAVTAADRLVELGQPEAGGLKWPMSPSSPKLMPNFSHGTAGIAYFLATAYQQSKKKELLDAALAGARYLQAVATTDGDACLIFHDEPDGKGLYYLGWCHGPAGTARLFYKLHQITKDPVWMNWVKRSARAIQQSGIPEKEAPGFWNNVSQCCGSAGVAEFFLSLYQATREWPYLDFARRLTSQILAKATVDVNGMKWIQAEHRVKPNLMAAQTGYMQGAAGIGMWLLHMEGFERGRKNRITLPDSPF